MEQFKLLNNVLNYEVLKTIHSTKSITDEELKDSINLYTNLEVLTSLQLLMTEGLVRAEEDGLKLSRKAYQSLNHFCDFLLKKSDVFYNTNQFLLDKPINKPLYIKFLNSFVNYFLDLKANSLAYEDVYHMIIEDF